MHRKLQRNIQGGPCTLHPAPPTINISHSYSTISKPGNQPCHADLPIYFLVTFFNDFFFFFFKDEEIEAWRGLGAYC